MRLLFHTLLLTGWIASSSAEPPASTTTAKAEPTATAKAEPAATESKAPTIKALVEAAEPPGVEPAAAVSSIDPEDLEHFDSYPPQVQQLVRNALALTKRNLTYTFGSSDPARGGMDCSGTIFHLLQSVGIAQVPRQSDQICEWVRDNTLLHRPKDAKSLDSPPFQPLAPGDLLFWAGTYQAAPRATPVTHVMMYLGKLKKSGKRVVFGASDGRVYEGERRTGVSVFDFTLPRAESKSTFYGFGLIPGIGKAKVDAPPAEPPALAVTDAESSEEPHSASDTTAGSPPAPASDSLSASQSRNPPNEEVRKAAPASSPKKASASSKSAKSKSKSSVTTRSGQTAKKKSTK